MDQEVCRRMRYLSTEQEPPKESHPRIPNPSTSNSRPIRSNSHGSHYPITTQQRLRRYPHHCRPRMHKGRTIPPLQNNNHGSRNCLTIFRQRIQVVRTSEANHLRSRPPIHIIIRHRTRQSHPSHKESKYCIPPTDGRSHGTKESMDRTIPTTLRGKHPRRLGQMAYDRHRSPQQLAQRDDQSSAITSHARLPP
jgi:hypothetical protein